MNKFYIGLAIGIGAVALLSTGADRATISLCFLALAAMRFWTWGARR